MNSALQIQFVLWCWCCRACESYVCYVSWCFYVYYSYCCLLYSVGAVMLVKVMFLGVAMFVHLILVGC